MPSHLQKVVVGSSEVFYLLRIAGQTLPVVGNNDLSELVPAQVALDAALAEDVRTAAK